MKQYEFEGEWVYKPRSRDERVLFESHFVDEATVDKVLDNPVENAHLINWNIYKHDEVQAVDLTLTEGVLKDMKTALVWNLENDVWFKVQAEDDDELYNIDIFLLCAEDGTLNYS